MTNATTEESPAHKTIIDGTKRRTQYQLIIVLIVKVSFRFCSPPATHLLDQAGAIRSSILQDDNLEDEQEKEIMSGKMRISIVICFIIVSVSALCFRFVVPRSWKTNEFVVIHLKQNVNEEFTSGQMGENESTFQPRQDGVPASNDSQYGEDKEAMDDGLTTENNNPEHDSDGNTERSAIRENGNLTNNGTLVVAASDPPSNNQSIDNSVGASDWFKSVCRQPVADPGWCFDPNSGKFRFFRNTRILKRRTVLGSQKCLANKHVIMIGNSHTRYQYLSLVRMLAMGEWERCVEDPRVADPTQPESCLMSYAHFHDSFNAFFQYTNEALRSMGIIETCYCVRINPPSGKTYSEEQYGRLMYTNSREVRYFETESPFGMIRVSFFSNFMDLMWANFSYPPMAMSNSTEQLCEPGQCGLDFYKGAMGYRTKDALKRLIPRLAIPPTHLFVNSWEGLGTSPAVVDIGCELKAYARAHCPRCQVWHMTEVTKRDIPDEEVPGQSCAPRSFDRRRMTRKLPPFLYFRDGIHVSASVNEELNQMLMNIMCGNA